MGRQLLGPRLVKKCQLIADKEYFVCYTTHQHYIAQCWYNDKDSDYVNYKVNHVWPAVRNGQTVTETNNG